MTPSSELLADLSREFALICDTTGVVVWADRRAESAIDARAGRSLRQLCMRGGEAKADELVRRAAGEAVRDWELSFPFKGDVTAVAFSGAPCTGGVMLLGSVVPPQYQHA